MTIQNKKDFKVLFVLPDFNYVAEYMSDYTGVFSLAIGYLSAMLKKHGYQTLLIHLTEHIPKKEFIEKVKSYNADLIAFSLFSHQKDDVAKYVSFIRGAGIETPIILGGVHATTNPEDCIAVKGVNYICVGEGEYPLLDLCNALYDKNIQKAQHIQNIWAKNKKNIVKNSIRPLLQNLDELPFPDREIFDFPKLIDYKTHVLNILTTRGCPYNCTYCCNHIYQKVYKDKGQYVRYRNPNHIIREIKYVLKKYPELNKINLEDDAFCLNKKLVKDFCEKFRKEIGLKFGANTRVNLVTDEMAKTLHKGGCENVAVGIESGNNEVREKILKRFMTNEQIMAAIKTLRKHHISVCTYNIIGLPTETIYNVLETIKLNAYAYADDMHVSIFQPYPNTELYDYCIKHKMIHGQKVSTFFGEYLLNQKSISKEEVRFAYKYFYIYIKLYRTIGKCKFIEKRLDKIFVSRKTHKLQLAFYPLMFFITNPMLATYRLMLKISPKFTRWMKEKIYKK